MSGLMFDGDGDLYGKCKVDLYGKCKVDLLDKNKQNMVKGWYFGGLCNILMSAMIDKTTSDIVEDEMRYISAIYIRQMIKRLSPALALSTAPIFSNLYQAIFQQYMQKSCFKIPRDATTSDIVAKAEKINEGLANAIRKLLENQQFATIIKTAIQNASSTLFNSEKNTPHSLGFTRPNEEVLSGKPISQVLFGKMIPQKPEGILNGKITDNKTSQNCVNLIDKPQCLCDNLKNITCKDDTSFKCIHCNRLYHTVCMKKTAASEFCCYCHLQKLAPLKRPLKTIYVGLMRKSKKKHIANFFIPEIEQHQKVQVRCLRLKQSAQVSCLFPDVAELSMNGQRCNMFEPINKQSCLKYRKDEPFNLLKGDFYRGQDNTLVVSENIQVNKEKDIRNDPENHIIGLYVIEEVKIEQLITEIKSENTLGFSESEQALHQSFGLGRDDEITCQLVKIPLICPLTTAKIQIPARGVYCNHFQCFDLRNYLTLISESQNPRWKCPLCPALAFDFEVDSILQQIIKETRSNEKIKETLFFKNGDYSFIIDDEPLPERKNIRALKIPERRRQIPVEPQPLEKPKKRPNFVLPENTEVISLDD